MTNEDKQEIAKYMGCQYDDDAGLYFYDNEDEGEVDIFKFDLNDAGVCVQEMQKRGDWQKFCATGFVIYFEKERPSHVFPENYVAWLFNAENFFTAMAQWIREEKK